MKKIIKSIMLVAAVVAGMGAMTSCSDDDDSNPSRLFRPVVSEDDIVTGVDENKIPYIKVSWDNYSGASQYVITLATEDGSENYTQTVDTCMVKFTGLNYDTKYNVSVRSENPATGLSSKDYTFTATSADYPTMLKSLATTDIIDVQARVQWNNESGEANYDSLLVREASSGEDVVGYKLTDEEKAACSKIVSGLKPTTTYQVIAFADDKYLGKRTFKTAASENYAGKVCDLRGLDAETAYKAFSVGTGSSYLNLIDSLVKENPGEDIVVVLEGGVNYRMQTMMLSSTDPIGKITFVTGLTLEGLANICVAGNFDVSADTHVASIAFDKINFTDAPDENKPKTASNYGGTYLFNIAGKGAMIDEIKITNSTIKYKRGVCRIKDNPSTIKNFIIDNCVVDSIAGYGIINADCDGSVVDNVKVTNSTFSNCEKTFVVNAGKNGNIINNLNVENCTFVYCVADNKPFIEMKDREFKTCKLKNCVIGRIMPLSKYRADKDPTADDKVVGITGYAGSFKPQCDEVYFTTDVIWAKNAETGEPKAPLDGTTVSTDTKGSFKNPLKGDFTIINKELKQVGDPRWY